MTNRRAANGPGGRRPRPVALGSAAAAVALALAACGSSGSSGATASGGSSSPVRVGYLLPLTGVFTSNGTSEEDGFKLGLTTFGTSVDGHASIAGAPRTLKLRLPALMLRHSRLLRSLLVTQYG